MILGCFETRHIDFLSHTVQGNRRIQFITFLSTLTWKKIKNTLNHHVFWWMLWHSTIKIVRDWLCKIEDGD